MHIIKNIEIYHHRASNKRCRNKRGKIAETITVDDPIRLLTIYIYIYACS